MSSYTKSKKGKVIELKTAKDIKNIIKEAKKAKVIIEFYSPWCGACKYIEEFFEELAYDHPNAKFYKIDISTNRDVLDEYPVRGIPTFKYYNGDLTKEIIGADTDGLEKWM